MNSIAYDITVNILAAIFIALSGFLVRPLRNYFVIRKKRGLIGEWYAAVAPNSPNITEIIIQRVLIEHRLQLLELFQKGFGMLDFTCLQCFKGYAWKAIATVSRGQHLIGEWWSTREGAPQRGTFTLVIAAQGNMLYGYASGFNDENKIVLKKWVLGKTKQALQGGFRMLEENPAKCDWDQHPFFCQENKETLKTEQVGENYLEPIAQVQRGSS